MIQDLKLDGLKKIRPKIYTDQRGFFMESFRKTLFQEMGIDCEFVQENHSYSKKGTIRGMHFQRSPGQDKLIRVISGKIWDVAVDIRPHSPTFKQWIGVTLDDKAGEQLFIPKGFAHGFCVLSSESHVLYKVSSYYDPKTEQGFHFDDPEIGIQWPIKNPLLSERDQMASPLKEVL